MNYGNICKLPYDNNPLLVADRTRNRKINILTGISGTDLIELNIENEINRLQTAGIDIDIKDIETVNDIWNQRLTSAQRKAFTTLADKVNIIQNAARANEDSINRMVRNDIHQETNDPFEISIFGGTRNF